MAAGALIFDFDGIITDTEPVHMEAWQGVLEPQAVFFDEDEYRRYYIGLNDRDFIDELCRIQAHHFSEAEKRELVEEKAVASARLLEREIPLMPGVSDLIAAARGKFLLAICSGANRGEIEYVLKHFKWHGVFDPIVAADSVTKGKPNPEGYIRALEGLQERSRQPLLPGEVFAIEDSPRGIDAAKAAGLSCIAVSGAFSREELSAADRIVGSLAELDVSDL